MSKKETYNCILYEIGDKVKEKYGSDEVLEIEFTDLRQVGIYPTLFLKFKGKELDPTNFSNLYIPAEETIEKYKDGLKYFNEVKVKSQTEKRGFRDHTRSHESITFTRRFNPKTDKLTEEDLRPKIAPKGLFIGRPPIKENDVK